MDSSTSIRKELIESLREGLGVKNSDYLLAALPKSERGTIREVFLLVLDRECVQKIAKNNEIGVLHYLMRTLANEYSDVIVSSFDCIRLAIQNITELFAYISKNKYSLLPEDRLVAAYYMSTGRIWMDIIIKGLKLYSGELLADFIMAFRQMLSCCVELNNAFIFTPNYEIAQDLTRTIVTVSMELIKNNCLVDDVLELYQEQLCKESDDLYYCFLTEVFATPNIESYITEKQADRLEDMITDYIRLHYMKNNHLGHRIKEIIGYIIHNDIYKSNRSVAGGLINNNLLLWFSAIMDEVVNRNSSYLLHFDMRDIALCLMLATYIGTKRGRKTLNKQQVEAVHYYLWSVLSRLDDIGDRKDVIIKYVIIMLLMTAGKDKIGSVFMNLCQQTMIARLRRRYLSSMVIKLLFNEHWLNQIKSYMRVLLVTRRVLGDCRQAVCEFLYCHPWLLNKKCFYSNDRNILKNKIKEYEQKIARKEEQENVYAAS